jgi:acyl carrier protein
VGLSDIEAVLVGRLAHGRGADRETVQRALESGGTIDSLEGIELILAAEEVFGITVSDDELSSAVCRSVPALVGLVQSKLAQSSETKEAT